MYISLDWLRDFVEIPKSLDSKNLAEQLTLKTAEVENVTDQLKNFDKIVTGQIVEIAKHPNADKLKIVKVSIGKETLQVVCGGANLKEGMYVAVAKVGARVKWHGKDELTETARVKIRGVESNGMIVAANEIGLDELQTGPEDILDLSAGKPKPGTPVAEAMSLTDTILEFDNKSLTHRPDLWSHYGIAREVAAITDRKLKPLNPSPAIPSKGEKVDVKVKDKKLCPRFCALLIKNVKVQSSPDWLTKRLQAAGHGTHNNIVDATNYVMAEIGQPMHAFDKSKVKGGIIVRMAQKNEKLITLDGKQRTLTDQMGVVADHEKALSVAGVIGGKGSEITAQTTDIILEAANWHPTLLRRASLKLGTRTDAVQRFEKALDPNLPWLAIKRAAEIILKICPTAKIAGPITDIKNFNTKALKVNLDIKKVQSKIGVPISAAQMKKFLEKLEFKVREQKAPRSQTMQVEIPTFRATKDINIEDDLIEEIARMYGYENIPAALPSLPTKLPAENAERFKKHRAREILSYGLGFDEVYNYSFYGIAEIKNCLLHEVGHLRLLNYLSADQTHLRASLVPNLLKNLQEASKHFEEIHIYEIGRTYKEIDKYMPLEEKQIAGAIAIKGKNDDPFYEAKGAAETFFKKFDIENLKTGNGSESPYAHPSKSLSYLDHQAQTLGEVFMLHPQVSKNHDLADYSIAFFKLNFSKIMQASKKPRRYRKVTPFPGIKIDISVIVGRTTEIGTLEKVISATDQSLIVAVELFDIYQGENIGKDKKAVAFQVTLQAPNRTLTDEEMAKVQKKIFGNLEKLGGKIRGK